MRRMVFCGFLALCLFSCRESTSEESKQVENIVRIFMHDVDKYTLFVREEGNSQIKQIQVLYCQPKIVQNVPEEKKNWARLSHSVCSKKREDVESCYANGFELFVHSVREINGAGWDHGNSGSGTTSVLE